MVHISGMKNFGRRAQTTNDLDPVRKKDSNTVTLNDIASLPERGLLGFD